MLKRILLGLAGLVGLILVAAGLLLWDTQDYWYSRRPDIKFAPLQDTTLKDPDNPAKTFRLDMVRVEEGFPVSRAELASLEPRHIRSLGQEELDQLYGRLTAGPIPDGIYFGDLLFPRADSADTSYATELELATRRLRRFLAPFVPIIGGEAPLRLQEALGGVEGRLTSGKVELLEKLGRSIWKGKLFYRDQRVLRNLTEDYATLEALIKIDDKAAVEKIRVPRQGRLLPLLLPTTTVNLLFPAKLHCGQSLLDGRRESIIIDYAFNDEVPGYQKNPDSLVGRNGLRVRDEVRMVRPGFYLGRAYANRILVLNFTLYNPGLAGVTKDLFAKGAAVTEDCWPGEQRHAARN